MKKYKVYYRNVIKKDNRELSITASDMDNAMVISLLAAKDDEVCVDVFEEPKHYTLEVVVIGLIIWSFVVAYAIIRY